MFFCGIFTTSYTSLTFEAHYQLYQPHIWGSLPIIPSSHLRLTTNYISLTFEAHYQLYQPHILGSLPIIPASHLRLTTNYTSLTFDPHYQLYQPHVHLRLTANYTSLTYIWGSLPIIPASHLFVGSRSRFHFTVKSINPYLFNIQCLQFDITYHSVNYKIFPRVCH